MARCLEAFIEPRPRTLAIICRLHLFIIAMSIFTTTCGRNPFILASMLPFFAWTCIWLSMISARFLCVKASDLLRYIQISLLARLARAHTPQPFTWAFCTPLEAPPIPLVAATPEDRAATMISPVQEEAPISPEQQGESLVIYTDSYATVMCRYSG